MGYGDIKTGVRADKVEREIKALSDRVDQSAVSYLKSVEAVSPHATLTCATGLTGADIAFLSDYHCCLAEAGLDRWREQAPRRGR